MQAIDLSICNMKIFLMKKHFIIYIYVLLFSSFDAFSDDNWDNVRLEGLKAETSYAVDSGTGFFVSRNIIVTSRHVVEKCLNIAVRGAVEPSRVILISEDLTEDLALLQSDEEVTHLPYLRINYSALSVNDTIFTIGYPLDRGESGLYISKQAQILRVYKNPDSNYTEIEFTDSVDHGNSGGPVLDANGNIIGVVKAKATYTDGDTGAKTVVGVAVGLDSLVAFLEKNNINFYKNYTYDVITNYRNDLDAKDYIVNIHCIKEQTK